MSVFIEGCKYCEYELEERWVVKQLEEEVA